jgi:hypothetical protein
MMGAMELLTLKELSLKKTTQKKKKRKKETKEEEKVKRGNKKA